MIIYGSRASRLGSFDVENTKCQHCESYSTQHVSFFGKYAYLYWIPIFPIGKVAVAECTNCLKTIEKNEFPADLKGAAEEAKAQIKSPWWHWIGVLIIAALVAILSLTGPSEDNNDSRNIFLKEDLTKLTGSPSLESDSISFRIKSLFDILVSDEMDPDSYTYYTRVEDERALILVQIPDLEDVEKSSRTQVIELMEMYTDEAATLQGKQIYIGVHGGYNMLLTKTPKGEENSNYASVLPLLDFYGPKVTSD